MNKASLSRVAKSMWLATKKHSPEILTGLGIAGMVTTTILAVRATPKALMLIEEKKVDECVDELTPVETVKTAWTCYIPTIAIGSLSTLCLIGASSVNFRRNAALAAAYALSESTLKDYQEKVVETIGEKKEHDIRDAIAKDKLDKHPVCDDEVVETGRGSTLCFDPLSGRYFRSDADFLRKAENDLNRRMRDDMFISVNEFYVEIGLEETITGRMLGWNIDRGYIDLDFSSHLDQKGRPCLVVGHHRIPQYEH